ncbi:MAG: alpha/beta hydrolase fold domain-containing protein [Rubripirellula sp.]
MFNTRFFVGLVALLFCTTLLRGDDSNSSNATSPFQSGDRVAFIGDSITAWGQYASIIQLFCQTRFPDQAFRMYNNALAGDRALYTRLRADASGTPFHRDILRNSPNVAVVMLGMNDAKNADVWAQPDDVKRERREKAADEFRNSMDELIGKLHEGGVKRITLVLSCPYDETTESARPLMRGKNDFIRDVTGRHLRIASQKTETPLIDFNTPMLEINAQQQKTDAKFSLADLGDRVHPLERGHFVMAYEFLRQTQMSPCVALTDIDAANARVRSTENCVVSDLLRTDDGVRFDCLAKSLPFPTTEFKFDGVVPFDQNLNQEVLRVAKLAAGTYTLNIDDTPVGSFTAAELQNGINLAIHSKTPQYRQAIRVKKLSARSWLKGNGKRHLVGLLRLMHIRRLATTEEQLAFMKSRQRPGKGISQQREAEFIRLLEEDQLDEAIAKSIRESESLSDQAWKAAVPRKHHYEIARIHAPEPKELTEANEAENTSATQDGIDLKSRQKAALERREWLQQLLDDHLKQHPESDIDGDGKLTSPERSIHVSKLYRDEILSELGDSIQFQGDIEYAEVGDPPLTLDLYLPPKITPENEPPLVVWFHGGGWRGGSKDKCPIHWLATNGFAVASVEYRSTLRAPFPNNIHDCKAAIRWLRANATQYGYNAERIGTCGASAGGHLAILLGTSADVETLEGDVGGNLEQSSRVQAAVSMAGVMRVDDWPNSHLGLSTILGLTHSEHNGAYELARLCSPDEHITADDPAVMIFHGDKDKSVPLQQSKAFHTQYVKAGLTSTFRILPNTGHVSPNFTDPKRQRLIINFFDRHLRAAP